MTVNQRMEREDTERTLGTRALCLCSLGIHLSEISPGLHFLACVMKPVMLPHPAEEQEAAMQCDA